MRTLLIILLVLFLIGMLPVWPYMEPWGFGYFPSSLVGLVLIIVLVTAALGTRGRPL
jgi:hypothetical protein